MLRERDTLAPFRRATRVPPRADADSICQKTRSPFSRSRVSPPFYQTRGKDERGRIRWHSSRPSLLDEEEILLSSAIRRMRSTKCPLVEKQKTTRDREGGGEKRFVGLFPPLADEWAQGPPYLCDACPRRHTSLPANVFTGHDASKNMITRVNILGISLVRGRCVQGSVGHSSFPGGTAGSVPRRIGAMIRFRVRERALTDTPPGFLPRFYCA